MKNAVEEGTVWGPYALISYSPEKGNHHTADLEKFVNRPQAENLEQYNVLKIAGFATMDEQKYMYQMLV